MPDARWDPEQYGKFADARGRPAVELLQRISLEGAPRLVYDLGCGDGRVTALLRGRWPAARLVGVDNSPEMLAKARESADAEWTREDIASWRPDGAPDLVYSNATLHWLPDHGTLFPRLMACLAPGGVLAVQMPRNFDAPSHQLMAVAAEPWRERTSPALWRRPVAEPRTYYSLLAPLAAEVDIWETEYLHVLRGADPVVEWTRGTGLRPVLQALDAADRPAFLERYRALLAEAYPATADGATLLPFRRLFIVARRGTRAP